MIDEFVSTGAGKVHVAAAGAGGPTILFVHGNSSSTKVFARVFAGPMAGSCRLLAVDMPGHGASEDAAEPERCYTLEGQGATLLEVLDRLALYDAVLVGWSFGGHVVLQALAAGAGAKGAMIIGTPPLGRAPDIFPRAFLPNPCAPLAMKGSFTEDEAARFARSFFGAGTEVPDFVLEDCLRTDGRARTQLFAGLQQGRYADEAAFVRESRMPLAVMVGAEDDIVNADYIRGLEIGNLWRGEILSPEGVGHGPFWEDPDAFGDTLSAFVAEVTG